MALTTSVLTGGTNSFQTTSEMVNFPITDFIYPGVVGHLTNTTLVAPMTGSLAVNAQGTPDMTVAVSAGACYVTATPSSANSQVLRVKNSASTNVTISANATGGTRYDWLYVKIDPTNAANPDASASNVATLVTSRSTSNTTDNGTPPTYGTLLAVVTVSNGAVSITNGNIADKRVNAGFRNDPATSEVNALSFASAVVGSAPAITATGGDNNINVVIDPKGTGYVDLNYTGAHVQTASQGFSALATGTTTIPNDDTIPQNTEGTEFMTLSITPKSTTNTLIIEAIAHLSHSGAVGIVGAIFQDSTANAIAAAPVRNSAAGEANTLVVRHTMVAGTTSQITFKFRAGGDGAGTLTFNGDSGQRKLGAITKSSILITEYKA